MSQNRYRRTRGGASKAAMAREIVRRTNGSPKSEVIDTIQAELSFNRAMARHYYYCAARAVQEDKYRNETVDLNEVQNVS